MPPKPKRKRVPRDPVTVRNGQDFMIVLLLYRERKAEAEARGETIPGIRKEDAHLYDIPF